MDELQVGGGRDVIVSVQLGQIPLGHHAYVLVKVLAHVDRLGLDIGVELDFFEKLFGDHFERVLGPRHEPVDGATVDQRREHAQAAAECVANGTHGQHDVKIRFDALNEKVVHGHGG